jgi:hypothetical protein
MAIVRDCSIIVTVDMADDRCTSNVQSEKPMGCSTADGSRCGTTKFERIPAQELIGKRTAVNYDEKE